MKTPSLKVPSKKYKPMSAEWPRKWCLLTNMQRRIAVGELIGWEHGPAITIACGFCYIPAMSAWHHKSDGDSEGGWQDFCPPFEKSLDDARELELFIIKKNKKQLYQDNLDIILKRDNTTKRPVQKVDFSMATAMQKCEAFYMTIGAKK
jgi:hypothetical protein